jgi:hypothetical protein
MPEKLSISLPNHDYSLEDRKFYFLTLIVSISLEFLLSQYGDRLILKQLKKLNSLNRFFLIDNSLEK